MNINLYNVYLHKLRKFGLSDNTRFQDAFVEAVNHMVAEMNDQIFNSEVWSFVTIGGGGFQDTLDVESDIEMKYTSVVDMALDYHLQDGGEWAIEPEAERERKWYGRGLTMARNIYQNSQTYSNPLGI